MKPTIFLAIAFTFLSKFTYAQDKNGELYLESALKCARMYNYVHPFENDSCFVFFRYSETDFALYENHTSECGGDPNTMPLRNFFVVLNDVMYVTDQISGLELKCTNK